MRKEKSELEWRKYWKEKAEKLQRENIELRNRLDEYELALNIWSGWKSKLIIWEPKGWTPEKVWHEEFIRECISMIRQLEWEVARWKENYELVQAYITAKTTNV